MALDEDASHEFKWHKWFSTFNEED